MNAHPCTCGEWFGVVDLLGQEYHEEGNGDVEEDEGCHRGEEETFVHVFPLRVAQRFGDCQSPVNCTQHDETAL